MTGRDLRERLAGLSVEARHYALRNLPAHLAEAGDSERLGLLLSNYDFLQAKLEVTGSPPLVADYDYLARGHELRVVQAVVRLSARALGAGRSCLAGQLLGRLSSHPAAPAALLDQASKQSGVPWLRPLNASLTLPGPLRQTLNGHRGPVTGLWVRPGGQRVVSASSDGTIRVWEIERGEECLAVNVGDPDSGGRAEPVIEVTADGKQALVGWSSGAITVWDLAEGTVRCKLDGHRDRVTALCATSDGRYAISGGDEGTIKVWDLATGATVWVERRRNAATGDGIDSIAVTRDGRLMLAGTGMGEITAWEMASGKKRFRLRERHSEFWVRRLPIVLSPDGKLALSPGLKDAVVVWDMETGSRHAMLGRATDWSDDVTALAVTPDGQTAIWGARDGSITAWDLSRNEKRFAWRGRGESVSAVTATIDGRYALFGADDGIVRVWDLHTGEAVNHLRHGGLVKAVASTPDGRYVLSGADEWTVKVWESYRTAGPDTACCHDQYVVGLAVTGDGRWALTGGSDGSLIMWDVAAGRAVRKWRSPDGTFCLAMAADGRRAVTGGSGDRLRVWDPQTEEEVYSLSGNSLGRPGRDPGIRSVVLTPDGRNAIVGGTDGVIKVWDLETGKARFDLKGHGKAGSFGERAVVDRLAVTGDGRYAVSASASDWTVRVWDLEQGVQRHVKDHKGSVTLLAVTPDGRFALSGDISGGTSVWEVLTGRERYALKEQPAVVAVTADSRFALLGLYRKVEVLDLERGIDRFVLEGHEGGVSAVAVTPSGRFAASGAVDDTLCLWDLDSGRSIASFTVDAGVTACAVVEGGHRIVAGDGLGQVHILALEGK